MTTLMSEENMLHASIDLPKYQTINTYSLMFPTLASMFLDEYIQNSNSLEMFLGTFVNDLYDIAI